MRIGIRIEIWIKIRIEIRIEIQIDFPLDTRIDMRFFGGPGTRGRVPGFGLGCRGGEPERLLGKFVFPAHRLLGRRVAKRGEHPAASDAGRRTGQQTRCAPGTRTGKGIRASRRCLGQRAGDMRLPIPCARKLLGGAAHP
jgi:hypothetical protein